MRRSTAGLLVLLAVGGCRPAGQAEVHGQAAKGPLLLGSTVEAAVVDEGGLSTGTVFRTQTTSDLGEYTLAAEPGAVDLEAQGYAYDEVVDGLSTAPVSLRAFGEVSGDGSTLQINVVTHLAHDRVAHLLGEGQALADAVAAAEGELVAGAGIAPTGFDPAATGTTLSLTGGDTDGNAWLFAVSVVLLRAAHDTAPDEAGVAATLQQLMNDVAADLADDGALTADHVLALQASVATVDVELVSEQLSAWLESRGADGTVPDLDRVIDSDLDGVANVDDDDVDGDGTWSGDDCDDRDAALHPGAEDPCGDGVDQDCDGSDPVCRRSGELSTSDADARVLGAELDTLGYFAIFVGDLDADGAQDVALGPQPPGSDEEMLWVVPLADGESTVEDATLVAQRDAELYSVVAAAVGDLTADGVDDLAVMACVWDSGEGAAYIFSSPPGGDLDLGSAGAVITPAAGELITAVRAGDLTGDGTPDLWLSVPWSDVDADNAGGGYVFPGPLGEGELSVADAWRFSGRERDGGYSGGVSPLSDLDGDGTADVVVADRERIRVFQGPLTGPEAPGDADASTDCAYCYPLDSGDVDGDGHVDLLAGEPASYVGGAYSGAATVFSGPLTPSLGPSRATWSGDRSWLRLGTTARLGDLDGDGQADVILGAPDDELAYSTSGGSLLAYYGPVSGSYAPADADLRVVGGSTAEGVGRSLDVADVDGDGRADLLFGAPRNDAGGENAGAAWLLRGLGP